MVPLTVQCHQCECILEADSMFIVDRHFVTKWGITEYFPSKLAVKRNVSVLTRAYHLQLILRVIHSSDFIKGDRIVMKIFNKCNFCRTLICIRKKEYIFFCTHINNFMWGNNTKDFQFVLSHKSASYWLAHCKSS